MLERPREDELGSLTLFMGAAVAGSTLAMLGVYAGLGVLDGFGDWDLHRVGRRFQRAVPWVFCAAAAGGALLRWYYARLFSGKPSGLALTWSIVRAFAHFPLFGALTLTTFLFGLGFLALRAVYFRIRKIPLPKVSDEGVAGWASAPLWFITVPFTLMKLPNEGDLKLPETIPSRRLLRWLPAMLAMLALFSGGMSEETGERVDPYWLAAFASLWFGDYLVVAWLVAPVMIARRRRQVRK